MDFAKVKPRDKRARDEMRALFLQVNAVIDDEELATFTGELTHEEMQRRMAQHSARWYESRAGRKAAREAASYDNVVSIKRAGSLAPPSSHPAGISDHETLYQLAAGENDSSQDAVLSRTNIRLIFEDRSVDVFSNRNLTSRVFLKFVDLEPGCSKVMVGKYRFRLEEWADDPAFAIMSGLTFETLCKHAIEDEHGQREIKAQSLD